MNIAIVDDERHCIESLELDLKSLGPTFYVKYTSMDPEKALIELPRKKLDILFLDVEMPVLNGFELLDQMGEVEFDVVFVTAYSEYAVAAFKNKVYHFLLKPVDIDELRDILTTWKNDKQSTQYLLNSEASKKLLEMVKQEGLIKNKIAIPVAEGYEFLETDSILYCQSDNNYTRFILVDGSQKFISKTLKEVDKTLQSYFFLRIHQSYLINPNFLKKYSKTDGGFVLMENGDQLPVSKTKKGLLTDFFEIVSRS